MLRFPPMNRLRAFRDGVARRLLYAWIRTTVLPDTGTALRLDPGLPVCYVTESRAWSSLLVMEEECSRLALPSPVEPLLLHELDSPRSVYCLQPRSSLRFWRNDTKRRSAMLGPVIEALQVHPDADLQLLPVSIFWGRSPTREKHWTKVLFADTWSIAGRTRKLLTILVHGKNTLVNFGEPVSLRSLLGEVGCGEHRYELIHDRLVAMLAEQRTATLGPNLSHRRTIVGELLRSTEVVTAIEQEADRRGTTYLAAEADARKYLTGIVAATSGITVQLLLRVLSRFWNRFYDGIELSNIEMAQSLARDHTLVYVPCHRSHVDYLLLSYVIYQRGLAFPFIAAGKNLDVPIIGSLLRGGGAFFIRRSFRGNALYSTVLFEYLHRLISRGAAIEYFVEGTRSRTGRSLRPRPGMLRMTVRSFLREPHRPLAFIPVYLGYEKLIEGRSYLRELRGQQKKRESLTGMLRSILSLRGRFGRVYVNFGEPVFLEQSLDAVAPQWRTETATGDTRPDWLHPVVETIGRRIMTHIANAAVVNSTNLVSLVLLATPRQSLGDAQLREQLDLYRQLLQTGPYAAGIRTPDASAETIVSHARDMRILRSRDHPMGAIRYFSDRNAVLMTYYRNNVLHLLALPSMIACCFVNARVMSREKVKRLVSLAYPFVHDELFLRWADDEVDSAIEATIEQLLSLELLEPRRRDMLRRPGPLSARAQQLSLLARVIQPVLERYFMILAVLQQQLAAGRDKQALEEHCFLLAQRLAILYELETPDFYDRSLFDSFVEMLIRRGYVETDDEQRLTLREPLHEIDQDVRLLLSSQVRHTILTIARTGL